MPNGEETTHSAPTASEERLKELLDKKDGELKDLNAQLKLANNGLRVAKRDLEGEKAKTDLTEEKVQVANEAANTANKRVTELEERLKKNNIAEKILNEEKEAQRGLRDFVQQSLSDILAGVDDAAVDARHRQLDGGLKESGFVTPGKVGSVAQRGRDSTVEFDLAVVAGEQLTEDRRKALAKEGKVKLSFMNVIPLGVSVEARAAVRTERRSEERRELTRHNRIRFSVPVTFARLDDPTE